jgi:hypothetical protein
MKAGLLVVALGLVAGAIGCSHSNGDSMDGGGHMLDDGHVQTGCFADTDCDTSKKCVIPHCNTTTHVCEYPPKMCSTSDQCSTSVCDMQSGDCAQMPANEGMACTTAQSTPGNCLSGICVQIPTCAIPPTGIPLSLACATDFTGEDYNSNFASPFGPPPTQQTSTYGSCATNETAPENAYTFYNGFATDVDVTIHLYLQNTGGGFDGGLPFDLGPFGDGGGPFDDGGSSDDGGSAGGPDLGPSGNDMGVPADVDLDLIILEGACLESTPCANPMLPSGAYQGITRGTGNETVTFRAKAGTQYYVVVDGYMNAQASYVIQVEACGVCQPTGKNTVGCDQSMQIAGDTSKGSSQLSAYTCATGGSLTAQGNEQMYWFPPVNQDRQVHATVTGASKPAILAVLPDSMQAICDPAQCLAGATASGTAPNMSATVSFTAANSFGSNQPYWIIVDTPSGMDTTYGLTVECVPTCTQNGSLDCTTRTGSGSTVGQPQMVSAWGPSGMTCGDATTQNLAGPEYVFLFTKPVSTGTPIYRFTLAAQTNNTKLALLVLDAGTSAPTSCAPDSTCAMTTPVHVAATSTTLESTGSYFAEAPGVNATYPNGRTAVVDVASGTTQLHYYWVVVDGATASDAGSFALSIDPAACN